MSNECPCHGCGERTSACHPVCERYDTWCKKQLAKKRAIDKAKIPGKMLDRYEAKDKPKRLERYKR